MKKNLKVTVVAAGVIAIVGVAGFFAYRAHGELEGLINGTDDHPDVQAPAGLSENGGPGNGTGAPAAILPGPASSSSGTGSATDSGASPGSKSAGQGPASTQSAGSTMSGAAQPAGTVNIGLRPRNRESGEGYEGGE